MNSFYLLKSFQNNQTNNHSPSSIAETCQKAQLSNQIRPHLRLIDNNFVDSFAAYALRPVITIVTSRSL